MIDLHTVGAGGGSIAWLDAGGALRVGPRSAGANPGPACYGTGTDLTVTDANLLLGRLDPDCFLPQRPAEIVNVRVRAAGLTDKPPLPRRKVTWNKPRPASWRPARFAGAQRQTAFYLWSDLLPGAQATGPAVITSGEATVVIPPRFGFRIDAFGNVIAHSF